MAHLILASILVIITIVEVVAVDLLLMLAIIRGTFDEVSLTNVIFLEHIPTPKPWIPFAAIFVTLLTSKALQ